MKCAARFNGNQARAQILISNAHLWDGKRDPYLYRATATLSSGDQVSVSFGCRSFAFDPQQGFFLNGRRYPLCGAAGIKTDRALAVPSRKP